ANMCNATRGAALVFVRPPVVKPPSAEEVGNVAGLQMVAKGLPCRAVYDHASLEYPGMSASIAKFQAAGERSRVVPELPLKGHIFDGQSALLPLSLDHPEEGALIVYSTPIVGALLALFETFWPRGAPIRLGRSLAPPASELP